VSRRAIGLREAMLLTAAVGCVAAPATVAAGVHSGVTVAAVVVMFACAPGAALLPLFATGGRAFEIGLVVATSLAVTTLVAQSMLWTGLWNPRAATLAVAGVCLPLVAGHLIGLRLSPGRPFRARS
jgi:hypothetical protein